MSTAPLARVSDGEGESVGAEAKPPNDPAEPRPETATPVAKRMTPTTFDEQVIRDGFREGGKGLPMCKKRAHKP